jgi:hypothetical protein
MLTFLQERAGFGWGERRFWIIVRVGHQPWLEPLDLPLGGEWCS